MSVLHVFLFGGFRVVHGNRSLKVKVTRAIQPLMAYLLLNRHRTHSREKLANLFWGDQDQDRARSCLRTALCRLRRTLESEGIPAETCLLTTSTGEVGFNQKCKHWLDVAAFEELAGQVLSQPINAIEAAEAQKLERALRLRTGELLEGFYDDWVLWERERLQRLYLNGLAHLLQYYRHHEAYEQSLECGHRILLCDPLREEIHREMMRLYLESGQRALAIQQYETCRKILATELNIQPMKETQALYTRAILQVHQPHHRQPRPINLGGCSRVQQALQQICVGIQVLQEAQEQLLQAIDPTE
jgi:DNA-binding SARP family transcriptional activator